MPLIFQYLSAKLLSEQAHMNLNSFWCIWNVVLQLTCWLLGCCCSFFLICAVTFCFSSIQTRVIFKFLYIRTPVFFPLWLFNSGGDGDLSKTCDINWVVGLKRFRDQDKKSWIWMKKSMLINGICFTDRTHCCEITEYLSNTIKIRGILVANGIPQEINYFKLMEKYDLKCNSCCLDTF